MRRLWGALSAVAVGVFLVACFFGISTLKGGFFIDYHPPFTWVGPGEVNLWLASLVFLAPAGLCLGYGLRAPLAGLALKLRDGVTAMNRKERTVALVFLGVAAMVASRLGNQLLLLGYPVTDDEWAAKFGGDALARGQLLVTVPFRIEAFPWNFMWVKGGALTSMDWFGTQLAWAISALTGTGSWIFALSAALPVPALAWLLARRLTPAWGLFAALLALFTPMAALLSVSTHGHLHSRAFLAVALAAYWWMREERSLRAGAATGLAVGIAVVSRPFETIFLLTPLVLYELWQGARERGPRLRAFLVASAVLLLPIALMFVHTWLVTGGWIPPRHSAGTTGAPIFEPSLWVRFGSNSAFNLLRLTVFLGGPLAMLLFFLGAGVDAFTRALAAGVGMMAVLGLLHDNYGVHAVGPIHYSEAAVPFAVLATHGAALMVRRGAALGFGPAAIGGALTAALALGNALFLGITARGLHGQAEVQAKVYEAIEAGIPEASRPAVLLAPRFSLVWHMNQAFSDRGSWVFHWKRPAPDFSDPILILHENEKSNASVRAAFPDRRFFRVAKDGAIVPFELSP